VMWILVVLSAVACVASFFVPDAPPMMHVNEEKSAA